MTIKPPTTASAFDSTNLLSRKPAPPPARPLPDIPSRSQTTSPEPTGAAQFITNLNSRQQAHLQFAIPSNSEPERFSQFLDGPRRAPVPDRFAFDAPDFETRSLQDREKTKSPVNGMSGKGSRSATPKGLGRSRLNLTEGVEIEQAKNEKPVKSGKKAHRSSGLSFADNIKRISSDVFDGALEDDVVGLKVDWRFYVTVGCLLMVNIVIAWDVVVISIALPTISYIMHGSAVQSFWLGLAFLVAATSVLPLFSFLADVLGRKTMLITGIVLFIIGSFIAGLAGNIHVLHLARTVQGMGAGGMYLLSELIASDLVSPFHKRRLNTALGAIWAIGAVTGPAIGEALTERSQWRWIFWINLPFCISAILVLSFFAKLKGATPGPMGPKLATFDWFGFFLLGGSLFAILLGLSWGGSLYSWGHTKTLLPLQFGLIGLVVFCVWSWFSPFTSMISMDGFLNRTSLGTFFGTTIQGTVIGAFLYFMPFFFTVAKVELIHLPAGVRWLPWLLPFVTMVLITFIVVSRWNLWLPAIWLGWALVVLGISLTTLYTRTSSNASWVCIAMVSGSGIGILYPSLHTASELIAAQDESRARRAITNYTFFHFLGKTVGIAMATSIFENELLKGLKNNATYSEFARKYTLDAVAVVARIRVTPGGPGSAKEEIMDIYTRSLKSIWIVLAVLAALAFFNSFFMMPKEMNEEEVHIGVDRNNGL